MNPAAHDILETGVESVLQHLLATLLHRSANSRSRGPASMPAMASMDAAVRWLRISYWVGAIVDAGAAVQMLHPRLFALGMRVREFAPGDDYRHAMGMGASLMLGWTALLLWADRRPVERRGVLVLTVFVIAGLAANEVRSVHAGFLPVGPVSAVWALQLAIAALFLGSSMAAARAPRR